MNGRLDIFNLHSVQRSSDKNSVELLLALRRTTAIIEIVQICICNNHLKDDGNDERSFN